MFCLPYYCFLLHLGALQLGLPFKHYRVLHWFIMISRIIEVVYFGLLLHLRALQWFTLCVLLCFACCGALQAGFQDYRQQFCGNY